MRLLAEDLLLLALDDEKGTIDWRSQFSMEYVLAASLLADLAGLNRVTLDGKVFTVTDRTPPGDSILEAALAVMAASDKPHDATHWTNTFRSMIKGLTGRLEQRLVDEGVLRREERKLLGVVPDDRYPTADPAPEQATRSHIRDVLLNGADPDERTVVLISLTKASGMLDQLFSAEERRGLNERIKQLETSQDLSKRVRGGAEAAPWAYTSTDAAISGAIVATMNSGPA